MDDDDTNFSPKASTSSIPAISTRPTRRIRKQRINLADEQEEAPPRQKGRAGAVKYTDASNIMGDGNSGYGWDREIDSDPDEPLNFEEQFILRVPPAMAPTLRELVEKRSLPPDVWFKFKDSRRAVFHMGNKLYGAKLVDLPALVESQKMTGLGGASVKVADISQMLLVEEEIADEAEVTKDQAFNIEDFIFPHGLTPPLKHVRKRRFRKRVNKRTIETVEKAVEKLLQDDGLAQDTKYELLDHYNSDSDEGSDPGPPVKAGQNEADSIGVPNPRAESMIGEEDRDRGEEDEDEEDEEAGSGFDSDLAAEINKGLEAMNAPQAASDSDSDGDGLFGGSSGSDDEDEEEAANPEELEQRRRIKLLAEEAGDLDRAIKAKESELLKAFNPIMKKRFEATIQKLTADRDLKTRQHATAVREAEKVKEGADAADAGEDKRVEEEKVAEKVALTNPDQMDES